jgi:hypothetical protein
VAKTDLARLVVSLEAQNTKLLTQLEQSEKAAQKWRSKTESAVKGVATSFKTLAIGAAMAKATRAITGAVDEMDRLSKTAQKIGVTTEALSSLEYAAKLADVSSESLQTGMTKLIKTQADAARGSKLQADLFQRLGIAYKETDGTLRAGDKVLADLADRFASMPDGAEKTAIAVELLGRSGANMIPLLNGGSQALRAAGDEARAFGLVVSTEAGRAAEEFNDNLTRLGSAVKGAALDVAQDLLPTLNDLSDQVVEMAKDPAFRENVANAIRVIGEAALGATKLLVNFANAMGYVYDEARQFYGFIDSDDLVRLNEQLEYASDNAERLARAFELAPNAGGAGALARAREEVALLEAQIASAEKKLLSSALIQPIDLNTLAKRKPVAGVDPVFTPTAAPEKHSLGYAKALMDESDAIMAEMQAAADERARAFESVQQIKFGLLDQEGQAVAALQAKYIELQNAVAAGAITQQESAGISAKLADQWAQDQESVHQREIDSLMSGLMTQEEVINQSYERRKEAILESTYATQTEKNDMILRLEKQHTDELANLEAERMDQQLGGMAALFSGFAGLAEAAGGEQSKAYKVMFGISKAFSIAQAALSIATGLAKAQELGFPANLAEMARVAAAGAQITAAISGAQFSGAYDKGGDIPAGQYGLVGERGPELVSGPASVTSRMDTARIFDAQPADRAPVNVQVVNAIDRDDLMNDLGSSAQFERSVMNVYGRNRRRLTQASV